MRREEAWCYIALGAAGVCRKSRYVKRNLITPLDFAFFFFKLAAVFLIFLDSIVSIPHDLPFPRGAYN